VHHPFGILGRAARIDDVGRVVGRRRHARKWPGSGHERLDRGPTVALAANKEIVRKTRRIGRDRVDFTRIGDMGDDDGRARMIGAIQQVLRPQLLGARDRDGTQAQEPEHGEQPGRNLRQDDDHPVALAHSPIAQRRGPFL
jgi:hypothetical protein